MDELTIKGQPLWQSVIFVGLAAILVFSFGSPSRNVFAQDSELETIEIQVTETITVSDTAEVSPGPEPVEITVTETITVSDTPEVSPGPEPVEITVTETITVSDSDTVDAPQIGTIDPDFFGTIQGVNADTGSSEDSTILTVMTTNELTVMLVADQTTVITNPFKPQGPQVIEEGWNVMISADKSPLIGADMLQESMAYAKEVTLIPDEPLGSHKRCTVVGQSDDGKSSLACEDGEQIDIDQTGLPTGTNAVLLVHPEHPAQVISTAKSLMERMDRFQASAEKEKYIEIFSALENLKKNVDDGFKGSQELAMSAAPPEVQQFMENLDAVGQKISQLAGSFASGSENVIVSAGDVEQLITMLNQIAISPEKLCCPMIDGFMIPHLKSDVPQESKDEVKALINSESTGFYSEMSTDLLAAIKLLEDGDMEAALEKLDVATANGEAWTENTVMPHARKFFADMESYIVEQSSEEAEQSGKMREDAESAILIVETMLAGDTDWIASEVKIDLNARLNQLKTTLNGDDDDALLAALTAMVELMQSLQETQGQDPTEQGQGPTEQGQGPEGQGQSPAEQASSLVELLSAASSGIQQAEDLLEANAATIIPETRAVIEEKISNLQQVLSSDNPDKIEAALTDLIESLQLLHVEETGQSVPASTVNLQCPPMVIVGDQVECGFESDGTLVNYQWTAVFSGDGSQISSSNPMFSAVYEEAGTVSLKLIACSSTGQCIEGNHTVEIVTPEQVMGGGA